MRKSVSGSFWTESCSEQRSTARLGHSMDTEGGVWRTLEMTVRVAGAAYRGKRTRDWMWWTRSSGLEVYGWWTVMVDHVQGSCGCMVGTNGGQGMVEEGAVNECVLKIGVIYLKINSVVLEKSDLGEGDPWLLLAMFGHTLLPFISN